MYYDLCVKADSAEETPPFGKQLGWHGFGVLFAGAQEMEAAMAKGLDVYTGVSIRAGKAGELSRLARSLRMRAEIIAVESAIPEVSRAALETEEVDILVMDPKVETGFNHITARLAQKSNVAICFSFRELLHSHGKTRADAFHSYLEAARLCRKFHAPFVISSCAESRWDLRSPPDLMSFGRLLGFTDPQIKEALSGSIGRENRKRLSGKWVMPGVEIE
ncbi:MAG: hypothetical protein HY367_01225 [Candidatus Aenigmarchaeota archaeon]|nr:hypothetical protein [Candidatus Aenigmarchaeota archaeon]